MDTEFWLQRWRDGQTGFHQTRVMPLLQKYWPALSVPQAGRVLVPLAGKSLDMAWLAGQGHRVLGVELSALAVEQFFAENNLHPATTDSPMGRHYVAGNIEVICGDIFGLDAATLAGCSGFYDRAALIALPPDMRRRYVEQVYGRLPAGCRGLLITLDYPSDQMSGPPFSVDDAEVRALYAGLWDVSGIDRRDVLPKEPKFAARGVTRMDTVVYRLTRGA
ncbi:MAG TPA: thiopurine S-methyltransferase [Pusillimonas sp.]